MVGAKPLIIVVDLDDDISDVLGISVVRGEEEVLKAALKYSEERPEDADLNAIFSGLSLYRKLKARGLDPDIAIVGGHRRDIVEAQVKIKERVKGLIENYNPEPELYIVGDGLDEVMVAEILSDIAPIAAVKRIVVEQHASIEASYALLLKYFRKASSEPRFSKYTLGVPGLILAIIALLSLFNLLLEALKIAILILGLALLVRGFGLETLIVSAFKSMIGDLREMPYMKLASLAIFLIFVAGGGLITYYSYSSWGLREAVISFLGLGVPIALLGAALYVLIDRVLRELVRGDIGVLSSIAIMVVMVFVASAFHSLGVNLDKSLEGGAVSLTEGLLQSMLYSRFIPNIVVGAALAGLLELLLRVLRS